MNTFEVATLSLKIKQGNLVVKGKNGTADDVRLACTQNTATIRTPIDANGLESLKENLRAVLQELESL
jgi:hypothetical protein